MLTGVLSLEMSHYLVILSCVMTVLVGTDHMTGTLTTPCTQVEPTHQSAGRSILQGDDQKQAQGLSQP